MTLRLSTVGSLLVVGVLMISSFVGPSPQTWRDRPGNRLGRAGRTPPQRNCRRWWSIPTRR